MSDETAGSAPEFTAQPTTKWAVVVSDSGDVRFDWERIGEFAAMHGSDTADHVPIWCVAVLAARNAALEEAAQRMELLIAEVANGRADVAIGCELGAAAIRELKDR